MPLKQGAAEKNETAGAASRPRTAEYIADLAGEMAKLAQRERLSPLDRLLREARDEARRISLEG